jgi:hypothetical protein
VLPDGDRLRAEQEKAHQFRLPARAGLLEDVPEVNLRRVRCDAPARRAGSQVVPSQDIDSQSCLGGRQAELALQNRRVRRPDRCRIGEAQEYGRCGDRADWRGDRARGDEEQAVLAHEAGRSSTAGGAGGRLRGAEARRGRGRARRDSENGPALTGRSLPPPVRSCRSGCRVRCPRASGRRRSVRLRRRSGCKAPRRCPVRAQHRTRPPSSRPFLAGSDLRWRSRAAPQCLRRTTSPETRQAADLFPGSRAIAHPCRVIRDWNRSTKFRRARVLRSDTTQ